MAAKRVKLPDLVLYPAGPTSFAPELRWSDPLPQEYGGTLRFSSKPEKQIVSSLIGFGPDSTADLHLYLMKGDKVRVYNEFAEPRVSLSQRMAAVRAAIAASRPMIE